MRLEALDKSLKETWPLFESFHRELHRLKVGQAQHLQEFADRLIKPFTEQQLLSERLATLEEKIDILATNVEKKDQLIDQQQAEIAVLKDEIRKRAAKTVLPPKKRTRRLPQVPRAGRQITP